MDKEIHTIGYSLEQPDTLLKAVQLLAERVSRQTVSGDRVSPDYRNILFIDDDQQRAEHLVDIFVQAGYRPIVMASALVAFTRFLQVPFVPFIIILSSDTSVNRLFLQRLRLRIVEQYAWKAPFVRLQSVSEGNHVLPGSETPMAPQLHREWSPLNTLAVPPLEPTPRVASPAVTKPLHVSTSPLNPLLPASYSAQSTGPLSNKASGQLPYEMQPEQKIVKSINLEGQDIWRYHIFEQIDKNVLSNVYRAYDRLRQHDVVLKAFQTDALPYHTIANTLASENLFQQEAELLQHINHPHIIAPWNRGESYISGSSFIYKTMEYYPEGSLAKWLYQYEGPKVFSLREVGHIVAQLADALQFLHDHQITFQNFKLTNLLVRQPVQSMLHLHLLLTDFAVPQDGAFFSHTHEAFPYVAPERWHGCALPASDQYALAVIAYELLTGRSPFQGSTGQIMKLLHTSRQPPLASAYNATLPAMIDHVLLRALAKRPEDRFASVAVFAKSFLMYCQ